MNYACAVTFFINWPYAHLRFRGFLDVNYIEEQVKQRSPTGGPWPTRPERLVAALRSLQHSCSSMPAEASADFCKRTSV